MENVSFLRNFNKLNFRQKFFESSRSIKSWPRIKKDFHLLESRKF